MKSNITSLWRRLSAVAVVAVAGTAGSVHAMPPASSVTLVPMSVLDGTSYHLDTLRSRIHMPTPCSSDKIGNKVMPEERDSFWMSYVGGYNRFAGDAAHPADYARSFQGLLLGLDRQLCCNSLVGIAFGYEESISRTAGARMDNDTYFIDMYAAMRTGCWNHRMSVGVGIHDISTGRGFDWLGSTSGGADAHSINLGYELSRDYRINERTVATPFMMINYGFSHYDSLHESIGPHEIASSFDDQNLLQIGIGGRMACDFNIVSGWEDATLTTSLAGVVEFSEHRASGKQTFMGESSRVSSMKREPFYGQLGFDLSMPMPNDWVVQAGVFGRLGSDRAGVAGNVGLQCDF